MEQQSDSGYPQQRQSVQSQSGIGNRSSEIAAGIYLIAWFTIFSVFYSLTVSVVNLTDTGYDLSGWARLFIGAGVATLLSFFIVNSVRVAAK